MTFEHDKVHAPAESPGKQDVGEGPAVIVKKCNLNWEGRRKNTLLGNNET
jgi:hypothetical protein